MDSKNARAIQPNVPTTSGATPNYGLPQWAGNDLTDWFELNSAFSKIDEVMKANDTAADTAQQTGDTNTAAIANLTETANGLLTRVTNVENVNTQQTQQITLNTTHLNEHDTSIQANTQAIAALQESEGGTSGDVAALQADVTQLQGQMTTANNNIATNADAIGNLSELTTTEKTNLVGAINEVAGSSGGGGNGIQCIGVAHNEMNKFDTLSGSGNYYKNATGNVCAYSFKTQNDFTNVQAQAGDPSKCAIIGGYVLMDIYYDSGNPSNYPNQKKGGLKVPFVNVGNGVWSASLDGANGACYVSSASNLSDKPRVYISDAYVFVSMNDKTVDATVEFKGQWESEWTGVGVTKLLQS